MGLSSWFIVSPKSIYLSIYLSICLSVLSYLILSCLVWSYLILSYLILSYLILSYLYLHIYFKFTCIFVFTFTFIFIILYLRLSLDLIYLNIILSFGFSYVIVLEIGPCRRSSNITYAMRSSKNGRNRYFWDFELHVVILPTALALSCLGTFDLLMRRFFRPHFFITFWDLPTSNRFLRGSFPSIPFWTSFDDWR